MSMVLLSFSGCLVVTVVTLSWEGPVWGGFAIEGAIATREWIAWKYLKLRMKSFPS